MRGSILRGGLVVTSFVSLYLSAGVALGQSEPLVLTGEITYTTSEIVTGNGSPLRTIVIREGTIIHLAPADPEKPVHLTLNTDILIVGVNVRIDGRGKRGETGSPGTDRNDSWTSGGARSAEDEWRAAGSEVDRGGPGGPGRPGTPGSSVTIIAPTEFRGRENLRIEVGGGPGGEGGPGGRGRALINGDNPSMVKYGPSGLPGPRGLDGPDGTIIIDGQPPPEPVSYVLTISGGISEGAYEAGYNWAFLRHLKAHRPELARAAGAPPSTELVGVTGASAGTINAALTAMTWCQSDEHDRGESAESNLFRDTWIPVGMDRLLPVTADETCESYRARAQRPDLDCKAGALAYKSDDGLLTRRAFHEVEKALGDRVKESNGFREGCSLPFGFTLTKHRPDNLLPGGAEIPFARFAFSANATTSHGAIQFRGLDRKTSRVTEAVGAYIHPPRRAGQEPDLLSFDDLLDMIEASSAFPVAFGTKQLLHCSTTTSDLKRDDLSCPDGEHLHSDAFFDGGVYDNVPLGLALSLVDARRDVRGTAPNGTTNFVMVDPDARRHWPSVPRRDAARPRKGLSNVGEIASNFVSIARKYELQALFRYALLSRQTPANPTPSAGSVAAPGAPSSMPPLMFSTRFAPIFGEQMGAFGAFFAKSFREFDYYVGIYDALYNRAKANCDWASARAGAPAAANTRSGPENDARCYLREFRDGVNALRLDDGPGIAGMMARKLLRLEFETWLTPEAMTNVLRTPLARSTFESWLAVPSVPQPYAAMLTVSSKMASEWNEAIKDDGNERADAYKDTYTFQGILDALRAAGLDENVPPAYAQDATFVQGSGAVLDESELRLLRRLEVIETDDQSKQGRQVVDSAEFFLLSRESLRLKGLHFDPSSVPDDKVTLGRLASHLAPYYVAGSSYVLDVGWRPTWGIARYLALVAPLSPFELSDRHYRVHYGLGVLPRTGCASLLCLFGSSVEASVRMTSRYDGGGTDVGGEMAAYLLGGYLRVATTLRNFDGLGHWDQYRITVGVSNVNGLIYWIFRLI